jgi:hypothetical protein
MIQDKVLLHTLTKFMNLTISRGITLPCWCNATNVLLEKDVGKPCIHRLRIIHLFEADFNLFLKIVWASRLVQRAVALDLLSDGQHGSVPRRTTMDPIMLTQLTTDLCHLLKINLARFDNDATACYDRIIVCLGMMAARRCGMPSNAIRTHADTLKFIKYTVKTVHGVSESNYSGTPFAPLFGTGQGSGASPAVWLTLIVILMNTMDRIIPERMAFQSPDGSNSQARLLDAFVDDTSLGFTNDGSLDFTELTHRLRDIAQTWEQLLHLSGGALNLKKCSWHILFWEWKAGRPLLRPITAHDPALARYQGSSKQSFHPIRRTAPTEASRILGVYLSPTGDFSQQIRVLREKSGKMATLLKSPKLTSTDVRIFHQAMYTPAMKYPLAAMAVDEEELNSIQTPILPIILQKLGVNRNLPTAIRHGPSEFGGLALLDLRTELGIETIKYLRNAVYSQSASGDLIIATLKHLQQEAGIGNPLLECPDIHIPNLTPTWLTSIRQYMSNHNITITLTDVLTLEVCRPGDSFIMEALHLSRYSASQQTDINLVRMYLQVTFLSDMTLPDGKTLTEASLNGERIQSFMSISLWPRQEPPTKAQQRLWRKYISSSFLRYPPYLLSKIGPAPSPFQLVPDLHFPTAAPIATYDTLKEYIDALPRTHRRLLCNHHQQCSDVQLWRAFRSRRRLEIVTDGGLHATRGTFGWKIVANKSLVLDQGSGPVDGPYDQSNSTRCEIGGFAAPMLLITVIAKYWGIRHHCQLHWIVDSKAAISKVSVTIRPGATPCRQPHEVDLLAFIAMLNKELRRPLKITWVKGHQDEKNPYDDLPRHAKLNVDADSLATAHRKQQLSQSSPLIDHLPSSRISIKLNGIYLTSNIDAAIRYHVNGYHMRKYLQHKHSWTDKTWDTIDMYHFGKHFNALTPTQQIPHMKMVHNQQPLGRRRLQQSCIKDPALQLCPCCRKAPETQFHMLQCRSNKSRAEILTSFQRSICDSDIHPVKYILTAGIQSWFTDPTMAFAPNLTEFPTHHQLGLQHAIDKQSIIGWHQAVLGFLSNSWQTAASLDMFHATYRDPARGNSVISKVLRALHTATREIWLSRKKSLHNNSDELVKAIKSSEAAEIRHFHSNPHLLPTDDQHYCERSLTKLLCSSHSVRRRWLKHIHHARATKLRNGLRQTNLTHFFTAVKTPRLFPPRHDSPSPPLAG